MKEQRSGLGCIGLPGMIALLAFVAFATTGHLLIALIGVAVVYAVIAIAMATANKGDEPPRRD
jgi:uncharacterized membrane protein